MVVVRGGRLRIAAASCEHGPVVPVVRDAPNLPLTHLLIARNVAGLVLNLGAVAMTRAVHPCGAAWRMRDLVHGNGSPCRSALRGLPGKRH
ncbi:MAG: hypothetical protein F4186_04445 [Boseongicola sp. SB0676_bin_33]|nr:hypothetical protein [Boseongicola sp. SB0676_bin_33]